MENKKVFLTPIIEVITISGEKIIETSSPFYDPDNIFGENGDDIING